MNLISRLENAKVLDHLAEPAQGAARVLRPGRARDALYGVWLGHPLHPVLVQVPVSAWLSASLLDLWPGNAAASRRLVLTGLVAAVPAALAGTADWSEQHEQQMRVGVVHALANTAAIGLFAASAAVPPRGGSARVLRLAGLAAAGVGGLLAGHLSFRQAAGANQAEQVPHLVEPGWHDLLPDAKLAEGHPARLVLGEVPVVAIRDQGWVHVLADRCSHLSGPLSDGEVRDECVTCPWHGSTFRLADGSVARGPATAEVVATEIVCWMRYTRHAISATGINRAQVAGEFTEHAESERGHAMLAAERISQLGGEPDFDPATIAARAHTTYETYADEDLEGMLRDNLTAERIVITTYQEIIRWLGDDDPTTRRLLEGILADEEEHADDLVDLLGT